MSLRGGLLAQVNDTISAFPGDQTITGGAGNDLIKAQLRDTLLNGGAGDDILNYSDQGQDIGADLAPGSVTDLAQTATDHLVSIETLIGSDLDDFLGGDAGPNHPWGLAGADTLAGGGDNDALDRGLGVDTATFAGAAAGVAADLFRARHRAGRGAMLPPARPFHPPRRRDDLDLQGRHGGQTLAPRRQRDGVAGSVIHITGDLTSLSQFIL